LAKIVIQVFVTRLSPNPQAGHADRRQRLHRYIRRRQQLAEVEDRRYGVRFRIHGTRLVLWVQDWRTARPAYNRVRTALRSQKVRGRTGAATINRSPAALCRNAAAFAQRGRKLNLVPFIELQKEPPARRGFWSVAISATHQNFADAFLPASDVSVRVRSSRWRKRCRLNGHRLTSTPSPIRLEPGQANRRSPFPDAALGSG
jgi:hypothetical protein